MKEKKYIVGSVIKGTSEATMKIYDDINYWSTEAFLDELEYVENCGVTSLTIHINTLGGSVYDGLSIYNSIMSSNMKITTIIDGAAMSMGSIIWAGGDVVKMRDIGLLMIHNPFMPGVDADKDNDVKEFIKYAKNQLRTIYIKRFGLSDKMVDEIMEGKDGVDGTYFTPEEAVKSGFLLAENIIETPPILVESKVGDVGALIANRPKYAEILAKLEVEDLDENDTEPKDKQPANTKKPIISQRTQEEEAPQDNTVSENTKIEENNKMEAKFKLVAAAIGCPEDSSELDVINAVNAMKTSAKKAKELESKIGEMTLEIQAKETSIENLNANLEEANEKLQEFADKEQKELESNVISLVDDAIKNGKIQEKSRDTWITHAKQDYEKVSELLNSIAPVVNKKITEEIAKDAEGAVTVELDDESPEAMFSKKIEESEEFKQRMALIDK